MEKNERNKTYFFGKFLYFRYLETLTSSSFSTDSYFFNQSMAFAGTRKRYWTGTSAHSHLHNLPFTQCFHGTMEEGEKHWYVFFKAPNWINALLMLWWYFLLLFLCLFSFVYFFWYVPATRIKLKSDIWASNRSTLLL